MLSYIRHNIGQNPATSHLTSTVVNMENGRCGMTFSMLLPDFRNAFAQLSQCSRLIIPMFLPDCFNVSD